MKFLPRALERQNRIKGYLDANPQYVLGEPYPID